MTQHALMIVTMGIAATAIWAFGFLVGAAVQSERDLKRYVNSQPGREWYDDHY